ncbi:tRNA (adenosine(37)-N6)-threonylcarbamoyltransferase complex dimerization subunit type 1 TsaB [Niabella terrae]
MVLLNIDTAVDKGSFCLVKDNEILAFEASENRNGLAGWLHDGIDRLMRQTGIQTADLSAVAVSNGPGSYTGLRVGLAAAKGLCYALEIPLICLSTLQVMAAAVAAEAEDLICPMIDARRMEVFTALYEKDLGLYRAPFATLLDAESFSTDLQRRHITFTGNGSQKFKPLISDNPRAAFRQAETDARDMTRLAMAAFDQGAFADVAYGEPFYVKEVYIRKNPV